MSLFSFILKDLYVETSALISMSEREIKWALPLHFLDTPLLFTSNYDPVCKTNLIKSTISQNKFSFQLLQDFTKRALSLTFQGGRKKGEKRIRNNTLTLLYYSQLSFIPFAKVWLWKSKCYFSLCCFLHIMYSS